MSFIVLRSVVFVTVCVVFMVSCTHDPFLTEDNGGGPGPGPVDPGCTTDGKVCFESNVLPIFQSSCALSGCHDAATHEEGFILDSYANIMRRGIVRGNANDSKLYEVLFETGDDRMPPDGPLSQAQMDSIALWINQGALNTTDCNCYCNPEQFTYNLVIRPMMERNCVGCHKPGNLRGNVDLSTYAQVQKHALNGNLYGTVSHTTGYTPMPQGRKLSDCEINQISSWVDAGALND